MGCGAGQTSLKKFDTYRTPRDTSFLVFVATAFANAFDGSAWYACKRR